MANRITRRTRSRSGSTITTTYTSEVKPKTTSSGKVIPGTPAQRTTTTSPSIDEEELSGGGNSAGITVALFFLLGFAAWKGFFLPLADSIWNSKNFTPSISPMLIVGGIIFIFFMDILASSSEGGKNLAWTMTIGMWLVFIMFNGSQQVSSAIKAVTVTKPSNATKEATPTQKGLIQHTF